MHPFSTDDEILPLFRMIELLLGPRECPAGVEHTGVLGIDDLRRSLRPFDKIFDQKTFLLTIYYSLYLTLKIEGHVICTECLLPGPKLEQGLNSGDADFFNYL